MTAHVVSPPVSGAHRARTVLAVRPTWRGVIHRAAVISFVPLSIWLLVLANTGTTRVATAVYAIGVAAMLGVSAVYHSGRLGPVGMARMKRVDHSTILLAIAGSYTAVAALARGGWIDIEDGKGGTKKLRIHHVHRRRAHDVARGDNALTLDLQAEAGLFLTLVHELEPDELQVQ